MSEHATLPPSSADQWGNCAGSVKAQIGLPDLEHERTRLGNAAHWVADQVFKQSPPPLCETYQGRLAPNGVIVDQEICEGAQIYVDSVLSTYRKHGGELLIEQRVHAPRIHPTENWGTSDASLYIPTLRLFYIWEYKHGRRDVKVENNLQLVNYLAGLATRYGIDGLQDQHITVVARVVQPFCYHPSGPIREWTFKLSDLRELWNSLYAKAHEALGGNPTLSTGPWCRDCKAVGKCAATRQARYNWVELVNEPYQMDEMSGADLALERDILIDGLAVGNSRLKALEDELAHRVGLGETDSGLVLETSRGSEKWTVPDEQVVALCSLFGVDASKSTVKTPKQTRDSAPKEVRPMLKKAMANVARRFPGKLKLVQAGNTRAARAFKPRK